MLFFRNTHESGIIVLFFLKNTYCTTSDFLLKYLGLQFYDVLLDIFSITPLLILLYVNCTGQRTQY